MSVKSIIRRLLYGKRSYFKAAQTSNLVSGWIMRPVSIDRQLYSDNQKIRARARELELNSPHVRQYLALLCDNVVGPQGYKFQAQIRNNSGKLNRQFNDKIESAWAEWARMCSSDGRLDLVELQHVALRTVARDGEVFVRMVPGADNDFGFALQLIDADMLDETFNRRAGAQGAEVRLGVEVDAWGKPVAYHFWKGPEDDVNGQATRTRERVSADQILHLYRPDRPGQTRGFSWLASVMQTLKILDGYVEAELVAARTGAAKMGFFKPSAEVYEPPDRDASVIPPLQGDAGNIPVLPPGVEFEAWNPDHPSAAFSEFVKANLRQISSGLQVSYNALTNDLENVNYSSIRSGLLIERDHWRSIQRWWAARFLQPVYEQWIRYAMLSGRVVLDSRDSRKFLSVRYYPRGWAWVDPLKDAQAAILQIENKLGTRSEALAEKGTDFETVCEQLEIEQALEKEYNLGPKPEAKPEATQKPTENKDNTEANDGPAE
jgi:lambda family phage portal protein